MSLLVEQVKKTISRHGMVMPGDRLLAAVSGGPDSVAMLYVLNSLSAELGFTLAVAHLNHGFRPEAADEAGFVRAEAERLGLQSVIREAAPGEIPDGANRQAAAREFRYGFLRDAAARLGATKVAVGHNADDQAETWLMRELRGSGARGLSAIPPVRGEIIRPLIDATREEIMGYITENRIAYVTDRSNLKPVYLRNRLRIEVMPMLREINPNLTATAARAADVHRAEDEFLEAYTADAIRGLVTDNRGRLSIPAAALSGLPEAIRRRALRQLVRRAKGDLLGIGYVHIQDAEELAASGGTGCVLHAPGGVRLGLSYGTLSVYLEDDGPEPFDIALPVPGTVRLPDGSVVEARMAEGPAEPAGRHEAVFDAGAVKAGLRVRSRRPGDYLYPAGMDGKKKLKEMLIDLKVPRELRGRLPVVTCGGEIIWVAGIRPDRRFLPGPLTDNRVVIRYSMTESREGE